MLRGNEPKKGRKRWKTGAIRDRFWQKKVLKER